MANSAAEVSNRRREKKKEWCLLTVTIISMFLLGGVVLHMVFSPVYQPTKYGWTVGANRITTRNLQDQPGVYRTVQNEYFDHGFKRWGQLHIQRPTVFIIGDSFTEMVFVSNGEEWYSYLEKEFSPINLFVYGAGGYGSLQEYLVLEDFIDEIDPDMVIWQFCNNDYRNNSYESDKNRYPYNNFGTRPYLENKEIVYKMPMPFPWLRQYSRVADRLLARYDAFQKTQVKSAEKPEEQLPDSAYWVTGEILKKARQRAGKRPFFLFSTGPITDKESSICAKAGITCIPGVREYLESKEAEGITVGVVNEGHWNLAGNRYVGEFLIRYFRNHSESPIFSQVGVK